MVTDTNETYCGDHSQMYTNMESLCCTPETNTMFYVSYTTVFKKCGVMTEYFIAIKVNELKPRVCELLRPTLLATSKYAVHISYYS